MSNRMTNATTNEDSPPRETAPNENGSKVDPQSEEQRKLRTYFGVVAVLLTGIVVACVLLLGNGSSNSSEDVTAEPTFSNPPSVQESSSPSLAPTTSISPTSSITPTMFVSPFRQLSQDSRAVRMTISDCNNAIVPGYMWTNISAMVDDCWEWIPIPDSFSFPWDGVNVLTSITVTDIGMVNIECDTFLDCGRLDLFKYLFGNAAKDVYYLFEENEVDGSSQLTISFENVTFLRPENPSLCSSNSDFCANQQQFEANGQITLSQESIQFCYGEMRGPLGDGSEMIFKAGYQNNTHSTSWRGFRPLTMQKRVDDPHGSYLYFFDFDGWMYNGFPQHVCEEIPLNAPSLPEIPSDFEYFQRLTSDSTSVRIQNGVCESSGYGFGMSGGQCECPESISLPELSEVNWDKNHKVSTVVFYCDGVVMIQCTNDAEESVDCGSFAFLDVPYRRSKDIMYKLSSQEDSDALTISFENILYGKYDRFLLNFQVKVSNSGVKLCFGDGRTVWSDPMVRVSNFTTSRPDSYWDIHYLSHEFSCTSM